MGIRYYYYLIRGFQPVYEQGLGMTIRTGTFSKQSLKEAKEYYKLTGAKFPKTSKIMDFDINTSLFFLKYDIDDLIMMIRAACFSDAVKAFDSLRCLLALVYHDYSEDADIIPLERKPNYTQLTTSELSTLSSATDSYMFWADIGSGIGVTDRQLLAIQEQLKKVFIFTNIRRALACFYQSQIIYYTHLVSSYVQVHSRPELIYQSREDYRQYNFRYQEMLQSSLFVCYRGIEAIYTKNFRSSDFKRGNKKQLEAFMDKKLPNTLSRSRYLLRFYRQREVVTPKYKLLINMLEVLFRARNRAAHGHRWLRKHPFETFGRDLVDESKFFLGHLISSALW